MKKLIGIALFLFLFISACTSPVKEEITVAVDTVVVDTIKVVVDTTAQDSVK